DQNATGRSFGDEEIQYLREVLDSGTLTSTKGTFVKRLEEEFARAIGARYAIACSSGTAAVHAATAAVDPEPGDEIITTPITDMGALSPIMYQGAIPVFADVDPLTGNVTEETVAERISERTRAIIVTHLFGNPADIDGIMDVARPLGIPVIEDAAQAYLASVDGRPVGTVGDIGCFSLQQGKQITTGEGGLIVTSSDAYARRIKLFVNKAWPYGEANPDHEFLALNYRMSELQGAVALAQLNRLEQTIKQRIEVAGVLTDGLSNIPGIEGPVIAAGAVHSYWRYCLRIDEEVIPEGPDGLAARLSGYEVASAPRYVRKPAFQCRVFTDQRTFGKSRWPFSLARPEAVDYSEELFTGTTAALAEMLVLPLNERYTIEQAKYLVETIGRAAEEARSST
ncbi:MAG: DegT/DnrJ/EryC1/StrS family aminotransferase, partial [Actinomycetota bacterium]|nr:DegT/DnrJ/EryC1/StrS family aminotransferase [Actinomycetota bacterium]